MISLTPAEVTPALAALFDSRRPTMLRAFAVLRGINRGHILADDPARPTWGAVHEATYGTLYVGGDLAAAQLGALVGKLRETADVGIGCWPDDPLAAILPPDPHYDGRTLYFPVREPAVALAPLLSAVPQGYRLVPRDERLFARSFDYADTLASFGSIGSVMQYTRGMALLHNGFLACEAATGAPIDGQIEVGVTTHEQYRQRGLATVTCAALIAACEADGLATWWDCASQNLASARLARRLGYRDEREYRYVWWPKR